MRARESRSPGASATAVISLFVLGSAPIKSPNLLALDGAQCMAVDSYASHFASALSRMTPQKKLPHRTQPRRVWPSGLRTTT